MFIYRPLVDWDQTHLRLAGRLLEQACDRASDRLLHSALAVRQYCEDEPSKLEKLRHHARCAAPAPHHGQKQP